MFLKKTFLFILAYFALTTMVYAVPDTTMSISPSAVDNTTIKADDENSRNSEVSSKFNAHSHTDISQTGNTLSIGDGVAGNKTIKANNTDTTKPYIQFDDTNNKWIISADTITGITIHSNAVYIHGSAAKLYIGQPDGGCSSCGVDAAGTAWSCADATCP